MLEDHLAVVAQPGVEQHAPVQRRAGLGDAGGHGEFGHLRAGFEDQRPGEERAHLLGVLLPHPGGDVDENDRAYQVGPQRGHGQGDEAADRLADQDLRLIAGQYLDGGQHGGSDGTGRVVEVGAPARVAVAGQVEHEGRPAQPQDGRVPGVRVQRRAVQERDVRVVAPEQGAHPSVRGVHLDPAHPRQRPVHAGPASGLGQRREFVGHPRRSRHAGDDSQRPQT
jgi:hypothetical protein